MQLEHFYTLVVSYTAVLGGATVYGVGLMIERPGRVAIIWFTKVNSALRQSE